MDVILTQDVKKLGKKGDVATVAEGYGRNYLIPRGLAVEATAGNMRNLQEKQGMQKSRREREYAEAQQTAARIEGQNLQIRAKVGEGGRLFGSITAQDIADRLAKQYKVDVDKRKIDLAEPIKNLGTFPVTIKLYHQVQAVVNVQVTETE